MASSFSRRLLSLNTENLLLCVATFTNYLSLDLDNLLQLLYRHLLLHLDFLCYEDGYFRKPHELTSSAAFFTLAFIDLKRFQALPGLFWFKEMLHLV